MLTAQGVCKGPVTVPVLTTAEAGTVDHRAGQQQRARLFFGGRVRWILVISFRRARSRDLYYRLSIRCGDKMRHACRFGVKTAGAKGDQLRRVVLFAHPMCQLPSITVPVAPETIQMPCSP